MARNDLLRVASQFEALARTGLIAGAVRAINTVANEILQAERAEMAKSFDRPTPYTLNSMWVKYANATQPSAFVRFKDATSKGTTADKYLRPQVLGGDRNAKRFESALRRIGVLYPSEYVVPASGAKLDAYGNISRAQIVQVLAYLQAFGESGFKANTTAKGKTRLAKDSKRTGRRGIEYFVSRGRGNWFGGGSWKQGREQHLPRGVYSRTRFGFGTAVKPIFLFVKSVSYRPRLDFYGVANRIAVQRLPQEMRREIGGFLGQGASR
jgi:hypothetical protein